MPRLKVVLIGNGTLAVRSLLALRRHVDIPLVICDARDTGADTWRLSLVKAARELGYKHGETLLQPLDPNGADTVRRVMDEAPDILLSVQCRHIIREPLFRAPRLKTLNLHNAPLPMLRGCDPFSWAIHDGLKYMGVSLHEICDEQVDAGPVVDQKIWPIAEDATAWGLYLQSLDAAQELLEDAFSAGREFDARPQEDARVSYHPFGQFDFSLLEIDWTMVADTLSAWIRARIFPPQNLPFFKIGTHVLEVTHCRKVKAIGCPGAVLGLNPLTIAAKWGAVEISTLRLDGQEMDSAKAAGILDLRLQQSVQDDRTQPTPESGNFKSLFIRRYNTDGFEKIWDDLVLASPLGTIFHTRRFLGYHPADRFVDHSLLVWNGSNLIGVFPAAAVIGQGGERILKSHPGATYGGLVLKEEISLAHAVFLAQAVSKYALMNGFDAVEIRTPERIFNSRRGDQIDCALLRAGFSRAYEEISTYFDLEDYRDKSDDEIIMALPQKNRPAIRKGISAGLQFRELTREEWFRYYEILSGNLVRHGATPTHSMEELTRLKDLFPDRVLGFGVFKETALIGGFVLFEVKPRKWHIFYAAQDYKYSKDNPLYYGVYRLLCWGRSHKYKYLNYGISTLNQGRDVNWGLLSYKESFNGIETIRTNWKKILRLSSGRTSR